MRVATGGSSLCSSKRESGEKERCIKKCVVKSVYRVYFSGLETSQGNPTKQPGVPKINSPHSHLFISLYFSSPSLHTIK